MSRFILICLLVVCALAVAFLLPISCGRTEEARGSSGSKEVAALEARVKELEAEVASLRAQLAAATGKPAEPAAAPKASAASAPAAQPAADSAAAAPAEAPAGDAGTAVSSGTVRITENTALKGVMGRIVVTFPKGTKISGTRTDIYEAGKKESIAGGYGDFTKELIPGKYDVVVTNTKVPGVEVKSRHDSTIPVGVLRVNAADSGTRVEIYASDGKTHVTGLYGSGHIGFPVGRYKVSVAGQSMPVEIKSGEATDF
jgi:hypothetical protein